MSERAKKPENEAEWAAKCAELAQLLIECRDALPAISETAARLRNIRLDLADRVDAALAPWEVSEGGR